MPPGPVMGNRPTVQRITPENDHSRLEGLGSPHKGANGLSIMQRPWPPTDHFRAHVEVEGRDVALESSARGPGPGLAYCALALAAS